MPPHLVQQDLNTQVQEYWEKEPCGTNPVLTGDLPKGSLAWYQKVEEQRYRLEPFIHSVAQFTRHHGKRLLEIGVGAGTDHLQWARAGLECHGVDLTEAAIETTRRHLGHYGLSSNLQRIDAETLPFENDSFDVVYSWGVIHHSECPDRIVGEVRRVLRPGGRFIGMLYGRHSALVMRMWTRHALLAGKPWRSFKDVVWKHMESVGTKAYTVGELRELFRAFSAVETIPLLTTYDCAHWPRWMSCFFPAKWGWFIAIRAVK